MQDRIRLKNVGPIRTADVTLGDLTVLVGPHATGKSIFLQILKLLVDRDSIHNMIQSMSMSNYLKKEQFFSHYFGEGMDAIWTDKSEMYLGKSKKMTDLNLYRKRSKSSSRETRESLFCIPAQRVLCLNDGLTRSFTDYRSNDPFVIRAFSQKIHQIMNDELRYSDNVFPKTNRISETLRRPLVENIFSGFSLKKDEKSTRKRLILDNEAGLRLPYPVWSGGQREFIPLLLGLYWLFPSARISTREPVECVVLEELENGLHPDAIRAVLNLIFEILSRGYKVILTTHSPYVLEVIWAIRVAQESRSNERQILELLRLPVSTRASLLASNIKKSRFRTYFFRRDGMVQDISNLDADIDDKTHKGWGGLNEFSGHIEDSVAEMVG